MFFAKIFRRFFFSIDSVLFNFIGTLYDLLIAISRTSILTQGDIATFAARIEVLLGIFMLFKVSFSLITYVVNPDDFSDKSKGFGKLIQSSVISLVLLVLVPYIFQMAFSLQTKVLEGNILARLILGEDSEQSGVEDNFMTEAGEKMAYYVMLPFFKPNYSINLGEGSDLSECINIYQKDDDDKNVFSEECKNALTSVNNKQSNGMDDTDIENYANGITEQSLGLTFRMNAAISTVGSDSDEQFVIDYKSPISTVVAVIVCLLLVSFCIDIGIRSIKLAFLQLIYPIPVISFMDPKSGKDGMFSKWYKMCLSTFLSLFVRLLALYFGLYIISKVGSFGVYDVVNGSQITNGWIMIFIIIGVLMFIKQLPKILENMGIKLEGDGKFNLNPLKRLEEGAFGGKTLKKAAIGVGAGGLAGAAAFGTNLLARKNPFSAIAGAVSGARRGIMSGLKGDKLGKAYASSYGGAMTARTNRADRKELGINAFDVAGENLKKKMHIANESQKYSSELKHLDDYIGAGKAAKTRAESEVDKKLSSITVGGNNLGALKNYVDVLKNTDTKGMTDVQKKNLAQDIANAESNYFKNRKKAVNAYMENAESLNGVFGDVDLSSAGFTTDAIVSNNVSKMQQLNSDYDMNMNVNTADLGSSIQNAENRQAEIKGSREYRQSELISQQAQKEKGSK